jgi:hypothetical protein
MGPKSNVVLTDASNITAPTQFIETRLEKYAYRRFGAGAGLPLLCLQHFTGTLDNWDPAVTDALALGREVILFESSGLGRSTGERFSKLRKITQPCLVVNGDFDNMIPVRNSYMLSEHRTLSY